MERKLYENAYNLVKTEIALSKGVPQEEAGNIVSDILASSVQTAPTNSGNCGCRINTEKTQILIKDLSMTHVYKVLLRSLSLLYLSVSYFHVWGFTSTKYIHRINIYRHHWCYIL